MRNPVYISAFHALLFILMLSCKQHSLNLRGSNVKDISANEIKHLGIDTLLIDKYDSLIYKNPGEPFDYTNDQNGFGNVLGEYGCYLKINSSIFRLRFDSNTKDSLIIERKFDRRWLMDTKIYFIGKSLHIKDSNLDGYSDLIIDTKLASQVNLFLPEVGMLDSTQFTLDLASHILDSSQKIFYSMSYSQDARYTSTLYQFKKNRNGNYYIENYYLLKNIANPDKDPMKIKKVELYKLFANDDYKECVINGNILETGMDKESYQLIKTFTNIDSVYGDDNSSDIQFWTKSHKQLLKDYNKRK